MDLLQDYPPPSVENPLIVFESEAVSPSTLTSNNSLGAEVKKPESNNGNKLELKHFEDQTLASDYICKICQFMVVDPREHTVVGQTFTCPSLFCYNCIRDWIKSGKSYCPSPGCLTIGFEESAFREIGARDVSRLAGLSMNCPFSCGLKLTYSAYSSMSHRNQCPSNPENMCKICKSPKVDSSGGHDCRTVFNEMRQKIDSLNNKNNELKEENYKLRTELDKTKKELMTKEGGSSSETKKEAKGNKPDVGSRQDYNGQKMPLQQTAPDKQQPPNGKKLTPGPKSSEEDADQTKEATNKTRFYSNSYLTKSDSAGIKLVFHYGEKPINVDYVQSTDTIRTLRSAITDKLGHDPGSMLFIRHKLLADNSVIEGCGLQMGNNDITILTDVTPNYGTPGFILCLRLPYDGKLLNFYSNNLKPRPGADQIKLTFVLNGERYMTDSVDIKRTIGYVRNQAVPLNGNNPIKMVYMTHLILEDSMTVDQCGFPLGTTDITLVPASLKLRYSPYSEGLHLCRTIKTHPPTDCPPTYGANGALHPSRFQTNKNHGSKTHQSNKSNSLASLV